MNPSSLLSATVIALMFCGTAYAQCATESEAKASTMALKEELTALQATQQAALKDFQTKLESKAAERAWTNEQKVGFLREASQTAQYASFELQKQEQLLVVAALRKELNQPENASDPLASCRVGMKMAQPMRTVGDVNAKQMKYLLERLGSASK